MENYDVLGIIAEYNPFHNGHTHHLEAARKTRNYTHTVAVMSGNFTQRGEPAVFDKYIRAETAIRNGIDLVLELPTIYATGSAEYFAYGAIELLDKLNTVNSIVFGSESQDISALEKIAKTLVYDTYNVDTGIKKFMTEGISFPLARQMALTEILPSLKNYIFSPNDILGIEYIKALLSLSSTVTPLCVPRKVSDYNSVELQGSCSSATSIRRLMKNDSDVCLSAYIPNPSLYMIKKALASGESPVFYEDISDIALYRLRTISHRHLAAIHDVSEGIEHKLILEAMKANSLFDVISGTKSKRYTMTRIQRIVLKSLLDIKKCDMGGCGDIKNEYIRVLAFNDNGRRLLRKIKKSSALPIITNMRNASEDFIKKSYPLKIDIKAGNLYSTLKKINKKGMQDFTVYPAYIRTE